MSDKLNLPDNLKELANRAFGQYIVHGYSRNEIQVILKALSEARDEVERLKKSQLADREVHDLRIARARKEYGDLQAELERLRGEG